jgi:putative transposase
MRPRREDTRLNEYSYFVSTQTEDRKPFFRHDRLARLMIATLRHYADTEYSLHAYVIMPDHLHLLITPSNSLERSIQMIKGGFSFRARREFGWKGGIWQEGFTDHRIRDVEDWLQHLEYIRQNPIRAALSSESVLYPYMNFPRQELPQGLKPATPISGKVRAEARTLQARQEAEPGTAEALAPEVRQEAGSGRSKDLVPQIEQEARSGKAEPGTLQATSPQENPGEDEAKRKGFSPSADDASESRALALEGRRC